MESVVLRFAETGKRAEEPSVDPSDFRIVQRWGLAAQPVRELTQFSPGGPLEGILNTNGEWWAVCRDGRGRTLVLSDPFSLQPLYYAHVWTPQGANLLVGPQIAATARAMHGVGAKVETEWAGVLPTLATTHDLFDTMSDVLTPVARLIMTRPDQAVLVDEDGFRVVARPTTAGRSTPSYEDLLQAGVQRATEEISATLQATGRGDATLNLSGGKDSRLVLAMVMAAGLGDKLQIHAVDPKTGKQGWQRDILTADLTISSRLVSRFGLSWAHEGQDREIWPDTLDSQLFRFQHHRGGRSFQFFPHALAYFVVEPHVRFTGAGAGALRSPWATAWKDAYFWRDLGRTPESFNADAMRIFRSVVGPARAPRQVDSRAMNRFVVTLREISDGTIESAVAAHYRSFRNRGHVGGIAWARSLGVINSNPLLQPEFVAASQMLAPAERDAGRMTYDLLELMDPSLNDLEFQSGPWPWSANRSPQLDWAKYPSNAAGFAESKSTKSGARPKAPFPARPRPDMQSLIARGLTQLRQALLDAKQPGGEFVDTLLAQTPTDLRGRGRLLTKLATWAHCMPEAGVFAPSADPLAPRVVTMSSTKGANEIP